MRSLFEFVINNPEILSNTKEVYEYRPSMNRVQQIRSPLPPVHPGISSFQVLRVLPLPPAMIGASLPRPAASAPVVRTFIDPKFTRFKQEITILIDYLKCPPAAHRHADLAQQVRDASSIDGLESILQKILAGVDADRPKLTPAAKAKIKEEISRLLEVFCDADA